MNPEEQPDLRDVLYGYRAPRTQAERCFMRFMGGVRDEPEPKRLICHKCKKEFEAHGYPSPTGKVFYPIVCAECAERHDNGHHWEPRKSKVRNPYSD